jgi:serine protease
MQGVWAGGVVGAAAMLIVGWGVGAQDAPLAEVERIELGISAARASALEVAHRRDLGYVPGEVLVKFKPGVTIEGQSRALFGIRSRPEPSALRWAGAVAIWTDPIELDAHVLARQLRLQPEVEYAEPNYIYRLHATPTDPSYATRQWNMAVMDMSRTWDLEPTAGRDVIVAVIDTGLTSVNQTFVFPTWTGAAIQNVAVPVATGPDIAPLRRLAGRDFVFFANGQPVVDFDGHGSHVAGTLAQEANNDLFGVGMAYQATILPLKVCVGYWELQFVRSALGVPGPNPISNDGGCFSDAIASAIRLATDSGAKVINMSIGGSESSQTIREAIVYAVGKGVFVAASMGNEYERGNQPSYPAAYAPEIPGFVSVAATNRGSGRSYYSSTGAHAELAAPGGDSREGGTAGMIWQSTILFGDMRPGAVLVPRFDRYTEEAYQGTSMASPHVAGAAALLIAKGITRPADIEWLLTRTAKDLGTSGRDDEFGYGLIQPRAALFGMGIRK